MQVAQRRSPRGKQSGTGPPCVRELEGWLSDRNCDLRHAIEFGNAGPVGQIGILVGARGHTARVLGSRRARGGPIKVFSDFVVDRCTRSETLVHHCWECELCAAVTRESCYGLRGVRLGASHPGPPLTRAQMMNNPLGQLGWLRQCV